MDTVFDIPDKKRLIVIVPDGVDRIDLARKIHWMAAQCQCGVLYLALVDDPENRLTRSRSMATMVAMTSDPGRSVEWELTETSHWLKRLEEILKPGDIIVAHAEQQVIDEASRVMPIQTYLQERLLVPVRTVTGYYNPRQVQVRQWLYSLLFWLGFLVILGAYTLLEIRLDLTILGVERTVLLVLVMLFEFATICAWNSITNRWKTE